MPGKEQLERIERRNNPWNSHRARNSLCSCQPKWKSLQIHGLSGGVLRRVPHQWWRKLVLAVALLSNGNA